jgi:DNA-binding beta-propeller fold protein YncE
MFVGPDGTILGKHEGEFDANALDGAISQIIADFEAQGLIDRTPLKFKLERDKESDGPLSFPGKVVADESSDTLAIADSNHNRIVVANLNGQVRSVVGSGKQGLLDGDFNSAQFSDPQGMSLDGTVLYVADTKNHAIRRVDLAKENVETIGGTGEPAPMFNRGGHATATAIKSPWDVALHGTQLFIAMAGFHQLWLLDLVSGDIKPHAGSGRENIVDDTLDMAQLAQPSGIVTDGTKLYFADSETSAIRTADLDSDGRVRTIVGEDLFSFGDIDGVGKSARLQHPLGVDLTSDHLYIGDTYNNKIKRISLATCQVTTLLGSGDPGLRDGSGLETQFNEPAGLSFAGQRLFIADTNNHVVRIADLVTGIVSTLQIAP